MYVCTMWIRCKNVNQDPATLCILKDGVYSELSTRRFTKVEETFFAHSSCSWLRKWWPASSTWRHWILCGGSFLDLVVQLFQDCFSSCFRQVHSCKVNLSEGRVIGKTFKIQGRRRTWTRRGCPLIRSPFIAATERQETQSPYLLATPEKRQMINGPF